LLTYSFEFSLILSTVMTSSFSKSSVKFFNSTNWWYSSCQGRYWWNLFSNHIDSGYK